MKTITLAYNRKNEIKMIVVNTDHCYDEEMKIVNRGIKYWGWNTYTETTDKGYAAVADAWEAEHPVAWNPYHPVR